MPRTDTPTAPDERTTLLAMLEYVRETALAKVDGLEDRSARTAPLSTSPLMAPGPLINHLRWMEDYWFGVVTCGHVDHAPMTEDDPDGEFTVALEMPLKQVVADYCDQIARSNALLAGLDLDALTVRPLQDFHPNVRWVVLHLIEETARHNGHLDLLRELADGVTGR